MTSTSNDEFEGDPDFWTLEDLDLADYANAAPSDEDDGDGDEDEDEEDTLDQYPDEGNIFDRGYWTKYVKERLAQALGSLEPVADPSVRIPELEEDTVSESEPVNELVGLEANAVNDILRELFQTTRPKKRQWIKLYLCGDCGKAFPRQAMYIKQIAFRPLVINPEMPSRTVNIALLCPTCMVQDLDFRRVSQRGLKRRMNDGA